MKPKKKRGRFTPKADRVNRAITIVKCTLKSILINHADNDNMDRITNLIKMLCKRATKLCVMASLAVLDFVNVTMDTDIDVFLNGNPLDYILDAFKSVSAASSHGDNIGLLSQDYQNLLLQYNVQRPSTSIFNNIFKYLYQQYETTFYTNIKTHAAKRVVKLAKLWHIQQHGIAPTADEHKVMKRQVTFMFNPFAKTGYNAAFIQRVIDYVPFDIDTNEIDTTAAGFMKPLVNKLNWFSMVPFFLKVQRQIDAYHRDCRTNNVPIKVGNFMVVPIHSSRMKHIRIDGVTFKKLLEHLKLHPTKPSPIKKFALKGKRIQLGIKEFNDARDELGYNPHWFDHFNRRKIMRMQRRSKSFDYQLLTDGVSVSLQFSEPKPSKPQSFEQMLKKQAEKYAEFGQRYDEGLYDTVVGLDPGYKLYIAGVIKNQVSGEESQVKITSRKFYNMMRQNIRDRKVKQFTGDFEALTASDRETNYNGEVVTPMSMRYMLYIEHRLKYIDEAIELYTTDQYSRLALDKYICTQRAMDEIVDKVIGNKPKTDGSRTLLVIGGTEFSPNSPIKKYRRCPGTRKLVNYVKKIPSCDVVFADEYNTSQVCGRCQRRYGTTEEEKQKHIKWNRRGIRMRLCSDCKPDASVISLPPKIYTKWSSQAINRHRLERIVNLYVKFPTFSMQDAEKEVYRQNQITGDEFYTMVHNKQPFNPNRATPLKCVWNRDISAARNIMIKGVCLIRNIRPPVSLQRAIKEKNTPVDYNF